MLEDIFTHLITNSIDHGIESASDRVSNAKLENGSIFCEFTTVGDRIQIVFRDDGKGIDLSYFASSSHNEISEDSLDEIAQKILQAGSSSKTKVTKTSGRGIGLYAVKQRIVELGGDIEVKLESKNRSGFWNFHFQITLPNEEPIQKSFRKLV